LKDPGAVVVLVDMPVVVGYIAAARYMRISVDIVYWFDNNKRTAVMDMMRMFIL